MPRDISQFHYLKLRHGRYGGVDVLGFGTYPKNSVLAGQTSKTFIDNFNTEAEARAAYPTVDGDFTHPLLGPRVSLNHLPGPDDMVAGGAYPDDIGA